MDIKLCNLIKQEDIIISKAKSKGELIDLLIDKAYELKHIKNKECFKNKILEREDIVSTGIGQGIAIPHSKLNSIDDFFIILAINEEGLCWDSIDNEKVKAVFLIGGPNNMQSCYLQILSKIILLIKNIDRRNSLFSSICEKEVEAIFSIY